MRDDQYKFDIKRYLESVFGELTFISVDYKNYCLDLMIHNKNINLNIEYKCRYFETGINDKFLYRNDILIELFQHVFEISKLQNIENGNINQSTSTQRVNTAIGWFYKCNADRLLYLRYLDNQIYDIIDLEYSTFKNWFMNNLNRFNLQFSSKTTGTINAIVKLSEIPQNIISITSGNEITPTADTAGASNQQNVHAQAGN